jgi:hypothetical protein
MKFQKRIHQMQPSTVRFHQLWRIQQTIHSTALSTVLFR